MKPIPNTIELNRKEILPVLFPRPDEYLLISGLAGAAKDTSNLTQDGHNLFTMAGTMGAAISMGLGVALSAPDNRVAVVTGDGEVLMNLGSLATVSSIRPKNLSIICIDNECHSETGKQAGHTSKHTKLCKIAEGAGISCAKEITTKSQLLESASIMRDEEGPHFFNIKVTIEPPVNFKRDLDPANCRLRFRNHFLKKARTTNSSSD